MLDRLGSGLHLRRGPARKRPPARAFHAEHRRAAPPSGGGFAQQSAQPGKAVRSDDAERHQLAEGLLDLRTQQAGAFDQLVEERCAVLANEVDDGLRSGTRARGLVDR